MNEEGKNKQVPCSFRIENSGDFLKNKWGKVKVTL